MDIQVWADFQCPYCMIGKKRLEKALEELGITDANVSVRSFLLLPEPGEQEGMSILEHVVKEYGSLADKVRQSHQRLEEEARQLGLNMHISGGRVPNPWNAHRLFQYAKTMGLGNRFFDRAQEALFTEGLLISDDVVLLRLAEDVGLPGSEAQAVLLDGSRFRDIVQADFDKAVEMNIDYVPYFMADGEYLFSGDLTMQEYRDGLKRLLKTND